MFEYKYSLEKGSKKFRCPKCGKDKRYVRYVDNETKEYLDFEYGRCDREQSCGYHNPPKSKESYAQSYYSEPTYTQTVSFVDTKTVDCTLKCYDRNSFVVYLKSVYDHNLVDEVISKYKVGTSNKFGGSPVFWQIDTTGNVRTGKIMAYDPTSGKRIKNEVGIPQITNVHSLLRLNEFNYSQCMFGEHLISERQVSYGIVESEKTAIIMSLEMPKITWISVNGKGNFNQKLMEKLKSKKAVAYPDKGCFQEWKLVAERMNSLGFNIVMSMVVEENTTQEGEDIADIFLKCKSVR